MSGVISKAIQILDLLLPQGTEKEMSVTEIGKELSMPVQSAHRLLSSLAEHGFVSQNAKTKRYKLGLSIMKYGFLMWDSLMLRTVARPFMESCRGEPRRRSICPCAKMPKACTSIP